MRSEKTGSFKVRQNLHYRFGRTGDSTREYRQAHIPLLLHQRPRDVLFMGLGTGLTAGGAIPYSDVKNIVAVELIPEVVEAARLLADHNYGIVHHPRVDVRIDDARHYLFATDRRFDVILLLPYGVMEEFEKVGDHIIADHSSANEGYGRLDSMWLFFATHFVWFSIPFSAIVSWVFFALEIAGEHSENPFEGGPNDVPITDLSRSIEIDIRQLIDDHDIPEKLLWESGVVL